ncbi:MAG: transposase [Flavobacteriales bacterium]|nr:transposase [Flavobacteriales bacterium]
MPYDPALHHRRSIRLDGYDYTKAGAYFITICTHNRQRLFGVITTGSMHLSEMGRMAMDHWLDLPNHHPNLDLDECIIMPDHMHGILVLDGSVRSRDASPRGSGEAGLAPAGARPTRPGLAPTGARPNGFASGSLGSIIASYKSAVTRHINLEHGTPAAPIWQRNYYEHIIRHDGSLDRIRTYIRNNPSNWRKRTLRLDP